MESLDNENISIKAFNKKKYFIYQNNFDNNNNLLESFYFKIKPIEGVITYKLNNWSNLPTTPDDAKKLAKEWCKKMCNNEKYNNFSIIIYFHLEYKTIRFELTEIIKLDNYTKIDDFEKDIIMNIIPQKTIYLYKLDNITNFPEVNECKELGKKWALLMEERLENKKVIVLLNNYNKNIKIIFKN